MLPTLKLKEILVKMRLGMRLDLLKQASLCCVLVKMRLNIRLDFLKQANLCCQPKELKEILRAFTARSVTYRAANLRVQHSSQYYTA